MANTERNKNVIRAFIEAINARDWPRLDQLLADDFVRHSDAVGPAEVRGRDQAKEYLRREYETFPDAREKIEDLVAEGDKVAVRHRFQGTQRGPMGAYPPSGKAMTSNYLAIYRLEDGRIAEAWVEWDNLSALVQLGHLKPPGGAARRSVTAMQPPRSTPRLDGLLEVSLYVEDIERSAAFYRTLFGLEIIASDDRLRALGVGGRQVLLLFKRGTSAALERAAHDASGRHHVAFAIPASDLELWKARLREQEVAVEETRHWPRGGVSVYFRDPDGHLIELATPGVWSIY